MILVKYLTMVNETKLQNLNHYGILYNFIESFARLNLQHLKRLKYIVNSYMKEIRYSNQRYAKCVT